MPAAGEVVYIEEIPHMVARANRPSAFGPVTPSGSTEVGVLRLDGVNLIGGHSYMCIVDHLRPDLGTAAERAKFALRWNDSGTAVVGSTEVARAEAANTDTNSMGPIIGWVHPATDVTASFILTISRITPGTGTIATVVESGGINITIIDVNLTVPDTGTDL